jgi:hypothetical protein
MIRHKAFLRARHAGRLVIRQDETVDAETLALWSLVISSVAVLASSAAVVVAILDWQQVSREEPWELEKLDAEHWRLRRNHRRRVFISAAGIFHHSGVEWINDAAFPAGVFKRGTTAVLRTAPNPRGAWLTLTVRKAKRGETTNPDYRCGLGHPLRPGETQAHLTLY